jgi:WD40 repeat protein
MQIRCPHCQDAIKLVDDSDFQSIDCPSCGSQFRLVDVEQKDVQTLSRRQGSTVIDQAATHNEAPVRSINQFELLEEVGRGAFGIVWRARDTKLDRRVAIKVPRHTVLSPSDREQFLREARAVAQLSHPNIVSVHEAGTDGDSLYIVSDFIDGISLAEFLLARRLSAREASTFCRTVAGALEHAHQQGVIHRDLKPSNIMLPREGQPQVMDFGLAKREAGEITMTMDGEPLGTPAYMPPEQARGEGHHVDRRADVYSLGVILYELLTGELPFRGTTPMLLKQVIDDEVPSPRKLNNSIPRDLETITLKCLQKDPSRRYQTAQALADDLTHWLEGKPITARPVTWMERSWRWCKRKPAVAGLSAAMVLLLLTVSIASVLVGWEQNRLRSQAEKERAEAVTAKQGETEQRKLATDKADEAERERQKAVVAEKKATDNATEAEGNLKTAERNAYNSDMLLAQRDWDDANIGHLRELLGRHRNRDELKGFEWDYWNRLVDSDLLTLEGHSGVVRSASFSPDGKRIVSGGGEINKPGEIKIWDAETGQEMLTLEGHSDVVASVSFSPDGKQIVSGSDDNTLKVWDAQTGQEMLTLKGHSNSILSVSFSPDGKRIVSGSYEAAPKVWDAETGQETLTLKGHISSVNSVSFSPDGKRIVSGSDDGMVKIWDAETGQEMLTLRGHSSYVWSVSFSPDGKRIVSGSYDNTLKVWDAETGQLALTLEGHTGMVNGVSFSPDGKRIVSGNGDSTLKVWDAETGQETLTLKGHSATVRSVSFSPDGRRIVSGSHDDTLKIWDAETGQEMLTLEGHSSSVTCVAFSLDGKRIVSGSNGRYGGMAITTYVAGARRREFGEIKVWDAETGQETLTLKDRITEAYSVAFSPNGRRIVSGSSDHTLKVWDAETGQEMLTLQGKKTGGQGHSNTVVSVSFSPDGKRIVSGSYDTRLKVWDAETGQLAITLKGHSDTVRSVSFSPNGRRIVSGSSDNTLKVWDAETGQEMLTLQGHSGTVISVSFSPDGKRIVSGSLDYTLKVWDAESGQETLTLKGHSGPVWSVSFSPDGKRIASGSGDKTLKVWDAETGQETLTLKGHSAAVRSVSFSPDGRIVSGSADKTLKVWDARPLKRRDIAGLPELPGVDLAAFPPDVQQVFLDRCHEEMCPCGCKYNLADCRIKDSACGVSLKTLNDLVDQLNSEKITTGKAATTAIDQFFKAKAAEEE